MITKEVVITAEDYLASFNKLKESKGKMRWDCNCVVAEKVKPLFDQPIAVSHDRVRAQGSGLILAKHNASLLITAFDNHTTTKDPPPWLPFTVILQIYGH